MTLKILNLQLPCTLTEIELEFKHVKTKRDDLAFF